MFLGCVDYSLNVNEALFFQMERILTIAEQ